MSIQLFKSLTDRSMFFLQNCSERGGGGGGGGPKKKKIFQGRISLANSVAGVLV